VAVAIFAKELRKNKRLNSLVVDLAKFKSSKIRGAFNLKSIEDDYTKVLVSRMSTYLVQPDDIVVEQN
jgi:uncharacterized protein YccT (UPF0319 family)